MPSATQPYVPPALRPTARAWQGYRPDFNSGQLTVAICAWCEDRAEAEQEAKRLRCAVTHTICPECCARMAADRLGERDL